MTQAGSLPTTGERNLAGKYLTFRAREETYGIDALKVREIIRLTDITAAPQMPAYARGVINLRGKIIAVMDLRLRFGYSAGVFNGIGVNNGTNDNGDFQYVGRLFSSFDQDASPSADATAMTQDKWKAASVLDPFVRSFTKNPAADLLKSKKNDSLSEAFLSAADGTKVAFLAKTSSWSHKGKAKHDDPMCGNTWQGTPEVDESTGQQQIQIAAPVPDGEKTIGSLVVGFNLSKLAAE